MSNCPARAGFTGPRRPADAPRWDHPRSRGVYGRRATTAPGTGGSSPLARGLRKTAPVASYTVGIIPARAGFTRRRMVLLRVSWDHPRSRGVYDPEMPERDVPPGSSPLARGLQPEVVGPVRLVLGIIPARAGFTPRSAPATPRTGDHPRSRGVYIAVLRSSSPRSGSSPLARGLQARLAGDKAGLRIIPARAGFTTGPCLSSQGHPDHPRSRGVYNTGHVYDSWAGGSSPLARGLRSSRSLLLR